MEIRVHLWSKQLLQLRVIFTNEVDVSTFVVDFFTFVVGFYKMKKIFTFEVVTNLHPRAKAYLKGSKSLT